MGWRDRATPDSGSGGGSWRSRAVAEPMRDAVAEELPASQASNPAFEIPGMSQTARSGAAAYAPPVIQPQDGANLTRALLTNEPAQGFVENVVRGIPATLGGVVGAAATIPTGPGSIAGATLGGAAGEGMRQNAVQLYAAATGRPMTGPMDVAANMGIQGVLQGAGQAIPVAAAAARPYANKLGAQVIRVGSGVPEKYGEAAMRNPSSLLNAPSKAEASAAYQAFEGSTGLQGLEASISATGKVPSEAAMEAALFDVAKRAASGQATAQELYTASQYASNLNQMGKMGSPRYATLQSAIGKAKGAVDDALQTIHPEYGKLRQDYFDAKMGEQFSSFLPLNQNTSPNVLRGVTAATAAGTGVMAGSPAALAALPLVSPKFYGTLIRGAAIAGKVPGAVYRVGTQGAAGAASSALAENYMRQPR
jgi:hypothetical protein